MARLLSFLTALVNRFSDLLWRAARDKRLLIEYESNQQKIKMMEQCIKKYGHLDCSLVDLVNLNNEIFDLGARNKIIFAKLQSSAQAVIVMERLKDGS